MPKRYGTKLDKIRNLLRRLGEGPCFSFDTFGCEEIKLTLEDREKVQKDFKYQTQIWLDSWIIPAVKELLDKKLVEEVSHAKVTNQSQSNSDR